MTTSSLPSVNETPLHGVVALDVRQVVTDILESVGAAVTAVRALPRERGGATPAAALTGATGSEHCEGVLRAEFQYDVTKPVGILKLVEVVATLMRKD